MLQQIQISSTVEPPGLVDSINWIGILDSNCTISIQYPLTKKNCRCTISIYPLTKKSVGYQFVLIYKPRVGERQCGVDFFYLREQNDADTHSRPRKFSKVCFGFSFFPAIGTEGYTQRSVPSVSELQLRTHLKN